MPVLLYPSLQAPVVTPAQVNVVRVSAYLQEWRTPVWPKPGMPAYLQPFRPEFPPKIIPIVLVSNWFSSWTDPVREKPGLKVVYQQTLAYHPRVLPTPNVTVVLNATEINEDVALFGINVYDSSTPSTGVAGAVVSIIEIEAESGAAMSIREP